MGPDWRDCIVTFIDLPGVRKLAPLDSGGSTHHNHAVWELTYENAVTLEQGTGTTDLVFHPLDLYTYDDLLQARAEGIFTQLLPITIAAGTVCRRISNLTRSDSLPGDSMRARVAGRGGSPDRIGTSFVASATQE
jgi:hypothetical protein